MDQQVPAGFRAAGVHCGIKTNPGKLDLSLLVADAPSVAAGVYTQNRIVAAPVVLDRQRTPSDDFRVLVANSGNANACTGPQGMEDARQMARLAAERCNASPEQVLVLSTGVIGDYLPMSKIRQGIHAAAGRLGTDSSAWLSAARGILTTDRQEKMAARTVMCDRRSVELAGVAKGAGMIGPRMATMLGIVLTDAALTPADAQQVLQKAVDVSFNCISVEGHMSTNDTVLLLASGQATEGPLEGDALNGFAGALEQVCVELARMIPADGEGASHLITLDVLGCEHDDHAQRIARTVANSPLVKTAITGADPNWGRIISAAGYAGVSFDPQQVSLAINGVRLFERGAPAQFDAGGVSESIRKQRETHIQLSVGSGPGKTRFWTSDLTVEYVKFNADYHT